VVYENGLQLDTDKVEVVFWALPRSFDQLPSITSIDLVLMTKWSANSLLPYVLHLMQTCVPA